MRGILTYILVIIACATNAQNISSTVKEVLTTSVPSKVRLNTFYYTGYYSTDKWFKVTTTVADTTNEVNLAYTCYDWIASDSKDTIYVRFMPTGQHIQISNRKDILLRIRKEIE